MEESGGRLPRADSKQSTQRQAVNLLDRLTPSEIYVSQCANLKAAWIRLTDTYGSPVYIACLLINNFLAFKLTKANDETNMLQLNNTMDKLESDLSINQCSNRCEDFVVIDHAEYLIPGKFRHEYVKKKDELLRENGDYHYKALSSFLKTETFLIQKYMPEKIVEDVLKETKDPKKTKETKAKVSKIEAKVTDAKATENGKKENEKENIYDKKASEDKIGKCPACNAFHYYIFRRGSNKGQSLASAFLTACPKYTNAAVKARATMIVSHKACAVCTD